jgi:hypothetical protein
MIDVTITSCGRQDLLKQTIESFLKFADLPISKIYVYEDSGIHGINDHLKILFPQIEFIEPCPKIGQIKALDLLLSKVSTEYYFTLEDDWKTLSSGFMGQSLDILKSNSKISEVWLRLRNERNGHPVHSLVQKTKSGTKYQIVKTDYRGEWHGTSFGPTLRRLSDYKNTFPNGYAGVTEFNIKEPWKSEKEVGQVYKKAGFKAATLMQGFVKHLGANRHISS